MWIFYCKRSILSILLFFVVIFYSSAQTISGWVKGSDNKGIENATVTLLSVSDSSIVKYGISNNEGYFELENLNNGLFNIKVSCIGYHTKVLNNIRYNGSSLNLKEINIEENLKKLEEVTVENKTPLLQRKVDRLIFNLNGTIVSNGSSLLEALRVAPLLIVSENSISMVGKGSMGVMVDDRPIQLTGTDLINYLKALRSENIEKIEIITTPPAKYGAQGNSGLINIVLKKNESLGWSGSVGSSYRQQTYASFANNLALFFRSKKISSTFTFNQSRYRSIIKESNDITGLPNEILAYNQRRATTPGLQANLSTNYELNSRNNIGLIYNISHTKNNADVEIRSSFISNNSIDSILNTTSDITSPLFTQTLNLYHDLKIDTTGKKISSSVNFFANRPETRSDFISKSQNTFASVRNNSFSKYNIWSVQSDLTLPYKWGKLEIGAKFSNFNNNSDVEYYNYVHDDFLLDKTRSNEFDYNEKNVAAYLSLESEISEKWSAKAGLRYEHTALDGYSLTLNQRNKRNYGALFPTAYIVYKHDGNSTFSMNYSRRIDRPGLNYLNPFAFYSNIYSYSVGNPYLLPAYSNNVELSYLFKGMFSLTVFTQHISDVYSAITTVDGPSVISRAENFLSQDNLGIYVTFNRKILDWWENSSSASLSFASPKSKLENISTKNGTSASYRFNNYFKVSKRLNLYVNYNQNLPSTFGNIYTYSQRDLTTGFRLSTLNDKLSVNASFFIGSVNKYDVRFSEFVQSIRTDYDYKTFNLGFTYLFGRPKVSGNKKNISFDEKRRAQK